MTTNALRLQYPGAGTLSPRSQYDSLSPTSNYPSSIGASPGFFPLAYQISPRFGASAFIPPPDVFATGRTESARSNGGGYTPKESRKRNSEVLGNDPVALHLLVETAMGDSSHFDILTVEEVETLKQEQKGLDVRLSAARRKLESETKIRDATRSLNRLAKKGNGHDRGMSSKGGNSVQDYDEKDQAGLDAINEKVENLIREVLETESRMRIIDMQLLMHTAAVLQLTHKGPKKRNENTGAADDLMRRPDSPASLNTYDFRGINGGRGDFDFDERSLYRSPENLDGMMSILQNGTHHQATASSDVADTAKRLEELNKRMRTLLVELHPEQAREYPAPPSASDVSQDASVIERQLDFLDQSLRDVSAGQANMRNDSRQAPSEAEGRIEGINHQLYAMLTGSDHDGRNEIPLPPSVTDDGLVEQLNYMENSFAQLQQVQYSLKEQISEQGSRGVGGDDFGVERYETELKRLWETILAGEEEARERKRERRRLLAEDPDADEQLSPDEDYNTNETFSLIAFSSKVEWLFRRATNLKDKQSVLMRQIKQQRELNNKSDAQKEAEFQRLHEQVMSARSEKQTMEKELERAIDQLEQFDGKGAPNEMETLRAQLNEAQERSMAYENQFRDVQEKAIDLQTQLHFAEEQRTATEKQLKDHQERSTAFSVQSREVEERSAGYEAQIRDAQERALLLESKLREAQDDARVEAAAIQAEISESAERMAKVSAALKAMTAEKEIAEARSLDATNSLNAKQDESRNLEGEIVRLTTELAFAKAELDGAYGTRAQRAADSAANPIIKRELDELSDRNRAFQNELEALRNVQDAASQSEAEARQSERTLKAELSGMAAEYEALTRDAIQNEKDRDVLENHIDRLRDDKEVLERELSDEKVKWLGVRSPGMPNGGAGQLDMGATSIRMLREDFRKMMRDRTAEGLKALRAEQDERRKLEALVRQLRKEANPPRLNTPRVNGGQ